MANQITVDDVIREMEREISVRKRVYPKWILLRKISKPVADKRLAILEKVLSDYKALNRKKGTQANLFD